MTTEIPSISTTKDEMDVSPVANEGELEIRGAGGGGGGGVR